MKDDKMYEKLRIAFKYGIKVSEKHPDDDSCDDVYFDRAIQVINRLYPKEKKDVLSEETHNFIINYC